MSAPARVGAAAVQLRVSGASFAEIADTLGLADARSAIMAVHRELADSLDSDDRDQQRAEESARLLELLGPMMDRAADPTDPEQIAATRTAVTIIDRRIKLFGLDAPTEIAIHTPTATELEQWVAGMVATSMPSVALSEPDVVDVESWEGDDGRRGPDPGE